MRLFYYVNSLCNKKKEENTFIELFIRNSLMVNKKGLFLHLQSGKNNKKDRISPKAKRVQAPFIQITMQLFKSHKMCLKTDIFTFFIQKREKNAFIALFL